MESFCSKKLFDIPGEESPKHLVTIVSSILDVGDESRIKATNPLTTSCKIQDLIFSPCDWWGQMESALQVGPISALIELTLTNIFIVRDFAPLHSSELGLVLSPHSREWWQLNIPLSSHQIIASSREFLQESRQVVFSEVECHDLQECWPCLAWEPPTSHTTHNILIAQDSSMSISFK